MPGSTDYEWQNDFADARNYSLEQASGDWILVMDADEVIAAKDHNLLLELTQETTTDNSTAYILTTRNYTDRQDSAGYEANTGEYHEEKSTGWIPSKKVRLFRNHQGVHFGTQCMNWSTQYLRRWAFARKNVLYLFITTEN